MPKSASPNIKGYSEFRGSQKGAEFPGGGLIIYIKEDIVFKSNGHCQRDAVELLSISVKSSNKKWITINSIYISLKGAYDLSWIPVDDHTIFAGDFNGHSEIWDENQPSDLRGTEILDWALLDELKCLNEARTLA